MEAYKKYIHVGLFVLTLVFSSCEKWLDVPPQTQIEADKVFEKESGFQDALTGVYVKMTSQSLYGRELTFGLVDGLGGQFYGLGSANQYYSTINYDYDEANFIAKSEAVFKDSYNIIANINLLIQNLNEKGSGLFTGVNYHTIRGEAYGLRALLHFDLVRLYGSSIASKGETALAIPYMEAVGTLPKERLTTRALLNKVIADLEVAEQELATYDPIVPAHSANATTYLRDRNLKLNYYAVKALQARVYLYAGDKAKALVAARAVIESNVFDWTPSSQIATTVEGQKNRVFTQELIFSLYINGMSAITSPFYDEEVSGNLLSRSGTDYVALFDDKFDYRFEYLTTPAEKLWDIRYSTKFVQPTSSQAAFMNRMPMIRKSELYYIAAECLAETDPAGAIAYVNEVRAHRNTAALSSLLNTTQVEQEIKREYRKELIGEGQLFFYYKRKNASQIDGKFVTVNDDMYVLPLPDKEISFGQ
ncbi:RagB/SusD family nutrient uptake outer membrane protein [Sphingobacterium tabacisoli]|uniref:RagB/SusD family nutrient uptake outer membrane protein n=1 Tax=Sphingobacterium tabacisoli TaxID=2044855 RepID=A0ABW5L909_9SPHI|nr:RagB/SusD family nutrient uptake outer membrane protein [Sphingobacterium tabacisoli]